MTRKTPSGASNENGTGKKALALLIGTICGNIAATDVAVAGPTGGVVTQGQGAISTPTNTSTVIDQASNRLSIDWRSFDVASNESVRFNQPTSNAVALNRILDLKPSEVLGRIDANGRIVLFNSHGIMFGAGSQVNVGSLLATSLNVISFDETTGQLRLAAAGSPGSIINNGSITASPGGSVSLVGGLVANNGLIAADFGSVNLAASRTATLDFYGGGLLRFEADSALTENAAGAAAGVSNAGSISADGGQVLLTTSAAQNVFSRAVNNEGLVSANRIENVGGAIRLVGDGGTVVSSGVLDASGVGATSTGGTVQMLGHQVGLFGNGRVDVSGDAGGGTALIGGDYQGANPDVLNANRTVVAPDTQINADARVAGDGGRVIVWSDEFTQVYGGISARGGAQAGNGGFVELSSPGALTFDGRVNLGAPAGVGGELLLDPTDITIVVVGGNVTPDPDLLFGESPANALVTGTAIATALSSDPAGVTLQATNNITVTGAIDGTISPEGDGSEGRTLRLHAGNDILINNNITTRNGTIEIIADHPGATPDGDGAITFQNSGITLNAGTGAISLTTPEDIALGTLSGGAITVTSTDGSITQLGGATITGSSLTLTADTNIALTTAIDAGTPLGTLSATAGTSLNISNTGDITASVDAGTPLTLSNTGELTVTNAASGNDVNLSSTGNLTVGMVNAGDAAIITSINGAILDAAGVAAISADDITLNAETGIGAISSIDLLAGNAGTPLIVNTAGNLSATVDQANGEINLELAQIPAGTWTIDLGGAANASGRILLQRSGAFDVDAEIPTDLFDLGAANTAQVGLRSGAALTLPLDMLDIFVDAPGTLVVAGTDIVDTDGGPAGSELDFTSLAGGNLVFRSGSNTSKTLDTDADSLTAVLGANANLTVVEADGIALTNLTASNVDVTSNGTTSVTAINANATTGLVTLNAGANAINGGGVVGNQLTISAASGVNLNTDVNSFTAASVGGGGIVINEASGPLTVSNATSTGGLVDISTTTGNLTVTTVSGTGVILDAGNNLVVNGTVDANASQATLIAGNQLTTTAGTVTGASASLTSNGAMALGAVNVTGNVTLAAGATGAISGGTVDAAQLIINSGSSVDLDTDVNTINANNVGSGGITIDEESGPLLVANANTSGAVDISTDTGAMTVTNATGSAITLDSAANLTVNGTVDAGAGLVTLTADALLTTTAGTVNAGSANLTSNGAMALGAVNTGGAVTLAAGAAGAISGGTVSGTALTVNSASSVNLNTNVSSFNASTLIGAGGITINEVSGPLSVANANTTGAVDISTTAGDLTLTTAATGSSVTLDAGGTLTTTTGTVNASTANLTSNGAMGLGAVNSAGNVTLAAGTGAITGGTVAGNLLTVNSAGSVNLATNVNQFTAASVGGGGITLVEQTGPLLVNNATSIGGAVNISTTAGDLTVTNAAGAGVTLNAGSAGTTGDSVASGNLVVATAVVTGAATNTATLIADGSITINTSVNAGATRDVTLRARDGSIGDNTGNQIPSVVADQLTIDDADAVELDTNVASLVASGVTSGLTIRDQVGDLLVTNAAAGGAVNVSTPAGNLAVTNASGTTVTLTAGTTPGTPGTLSATTVNATAGAANLTSNGTMTVGNVTGTGATLTANGATSDLTVTGTVNSGAGAASLTAGRAMAAGNVTATTAATLTAGTTLTTNAVNVTGAGGTATLTSGGSMTPASITTNGGNITLSATGAGAEITLATVNAGAGAVSVTAANGSITDDDDGTAQTTQVTGGSVALTAATAIGTVTTFETAAGRSVDVNTSGTLTANVTTNVAGPVGGQINLNIAGSPDIAQDGIRLGNIATANRVGRVLLQSASDLDLGTLNPGAINVGATNTASVGYVSGGVLTLPVASLTDTAPANLLISGTDVVNPGGTRTIGLSANTAIFNASAAGGDFTLNTSVDTLHSNVGNVGLTVNEALGDITLGNVTARTLTVNANTAGGSIRDDSDDSTVVTADSITLDATNVIGGPGLAALDVDTDNLVATVDNGTITVNSVGTGPLQVNVTSFGDDVTLLAAGDVAVTTLSGAEVFLDVDGAITDAAGSTPSVVATQLVITGAASADLDTNVNILNATGVAGVLNIREQTGALAVTNAAAGTVNVSTVAGVLNVTNATSSAGALTLTAGGAGNQLTVTNGSGNGANLTAGGNILLGTVNAGAGTATLAAGGAISDGASTAPSISAGQLAIANAASANLDTDVGTLNANNVTGALAIREQAGDLAVAAANAGTVDLTSVGGALTGVNASAGSVALTASTGISLNSVTATGAVALTAGGAITDAAGAAPSVNANQLTIAAGSANLDTNVNTLSANTGAGALAIREQSGALAVTNAIAGTVDVSTVAGTLTVTNATSAGALTLAAGGAGSALNVAAATGTSANLTSAGAISLGTINAGTGAATLAAGGAISDAAGATPSIVAGQLIISSAASANLDTNVNTLNASGVTGGLSIREQTGTLAVTNASAAGLVDISTVDGALTVANAAGNGVGLAAGGATSDLTVTGTVNAGTGSADLSAGRAMTLTGSTVNAGSATLVSNGALALGTVTATGTVSMSTGGNAISDAAGTAPSVTAGLLQISNSGPVDLDTDVNELNATVASGNLTVREQDGDLLVSNANAAGDVTLSNAAGGFTNVNATGTNVSLTASTGIQIDVVDAGSGTATLTAGGAITDTVDGNAAVVADQLTIASAGSVELETDVNTLDASNVAGDLTVQELTGALTVADASATGAVDVSTVAGALNVADVNGNGVTLNAGGVSSDLTVTGTVNAGAGAATLTAGRIATLGAVTAGSATLSAGGNLTLSTVNTGTGTTTLAAGGAIADGAGAAPSVVAGELAITSADSVDLDTDVNTLNANNVGNALMVREQTGGLAVTNANALGTVWISTVDGALTNVNASGANVNLAAGGAGNGISLGTVTAAAGIVDLTAAGAITDAAGTAPSVVANELSIAGAGSVDLDTNVNTLFANNVAGTLTVRELNAVTVDSAVSGGALSIATANGALNVTNASSTNGSIALAAGGAGSALNVGTAAGTGATLTSGGAMTIANNTLNARTGAASLTAGTTMSLGTVNAASATLSSGGAMTLGTVNVGTGAAALTAGGVMTLGTVNAGSATLTTNGAGNGIALGSVNTGTGTTTLAAGGAITDAAGATPSIVASQLTISRAASVDLDTNVDTLNASGVTGALSVREQTGALAVTNASATGAVNVSTVAGALNVTAASGNGVTLNAGGAGNTLTTTGTVAAGTGAATLTSGGAMTLATVTAGSATLNAGGAMTLGSVNAGTGNATLTATGAITDGTTGTGLTAGAATLTAASIGTAGNTLDTSVNSLTATTPGSMFLREANDVTLTNLSATTAGQDIVVGTTGNITVNQVSNANGRVLLAAGDDILATDGTGTHITAQSVELRAGLVASGGAIGTSNDPLRLNVPNTVGGGANGTGAPVPSVLLVQNESPGDPTQAAVSEQLDLPGTFNISTTTFDRSRVDAPAFLTTTFSTRSAQGDGVEVQNAPFNVNGALNTTAQIGLSTRGAAAVLSASGASNAQGEGTLYIDWASFDPNVSLFGTVNPPICLPADQSDEDSGDAAAATSSGCAATTAQYDGSFRMPEVKLVITSRGVEWVTVPSGNVTVFPLIGQIR